MAHPNNVLKKVHEYNLKHPELNICTTQTLPGFFERRTFSASNFRKSKTIGSELTDLQAKHLALKSEREIVVGLLHNLFPEPIIDQLQCGEEYIAQKQSEVTVLFVDIVNFVDVSDGLEPQAIITWLNDIFDLMDYLAERYKLEKIKTIGGM
jgi:class 3 adenylate cyclase